MAQRIINVHFNYSIVHCHVFCCLNITIIFNIELCLHRNTESLFYRISCMEEHASKCTCNKHSSTGMIFVWMLCFFYFVKVRIFIFAFREKPKMKNSDLCMLVHRPGRVLRNAFIFIVVLSVLCLHDRRKETRQSSNTFMPAMLH